MWQEETRLCLEHGVVHSIGDTIGPAALSKSLRTVPVMLGIARDMGELCPGAWLINVTNPLSTAVKAVASLTKTKVIGLCDGSLGHRHLIADAYGAEPSQVSFDLVGVNHFAFTNRISVDGRDVTASLYEDAARSRAASLGEWSLGREIFRLMGGWLPLVEDRHLTEFYPFYVSATEGDKVRYGGGPLDIPQRLRSRERMEQDHVDLASGNVRPGGLAAYRGEPLHDIISWLRGGGEGTHVVNVPNGGRCRDLRHDAVVEIPALLSRDSVVPVSIAEGTLAPHVVSILNNLSVIHDYTVQAAVSGDRGKARQALLLDPFLQNRDILALVPELVDGIFHINRSYLPA
jgi:alpha-galactosidase/6-phospho-beta-glucosidase family protein